MILVVLNDGETYTDLQDCRLIVTNQDDLDDHEINRLINGSITISSVLQDAIENDFTNHYNSDGGEYTEYGDILWKRNFETGEWEPVL